MTVLILLLLSLLLFLLLFLFLLFNKLTIRDSPMASNRRGSMVFRSRVIYINGLLDNRTFTSALSTVSESRYEAIRAAVGIPGEAYMVEIDKVLYDIVNTKCSFDFVK